MRLGLAFLILVACSNSDAALAQPSLEAEHFIGTWQGVFRTSAGDGSQIRLRIAETPDGGLTATFPDPTDPDWGHALFSRAVTVDGAILKMRFDQINGAYDGKLSGNGKAITGTWTQNKESNQFDLKKVTGGALDSSSHKVQFVMVEPNVKLEVLDWGGTGRPLILIAGLGNTAHVYDDLAAKLAPKYHVYGITRRGFGASSKPASPAMAQKSTRGSDSYEISLATQGEPNPYDADRLGDDVVAIIDKLRIERPILVGISIGGTELSSVGSRYPEKVAGLIYLDCLFASYAYREGPNDAPQFTVDHPMRMNMPTGERPSPDTEEAIKIGARNYNVIPVPILAISAVPHEVQIAHALPQVKDVRIPDAGHHIVRSNEADVLREMNTWIGSLPN